MAELEVDALTLRFGGLQVLDRVSLRAERLRLLLGIDVPAAAQTFTYFAELSDKIDGAVTATAAGFMLGRWALAGLAWLQPPSVPIPEQVPLDGAVPFGPSFDVAGWFARDAAILEQQRHDAFDGCGRYRNDLAARPEGRHAHASARGVKNRPALLATAKAKVEHDAPVDQAAAAGMPFGAG